MGVIWERLKNGIFNENVIFVQVLAMCPTLAVTSSFNNGIGMGLASTVVLMGANFVISLLRKFIPDKVRIPAFIVVIAAFVTLLQFMLAGFVPELNKSLGMFIPLIVVNCVILGRAESYASKNGPISSIFDGLGQGLGFTLSLGIIGFVRELLGTGKILDGFMGLKAIQVIPNKVDPALIFVLAPGAFITLGIMMAIVNQRKIRKSKSK
ncbi:electron transport complex subunit E [Clostridium botulinum]|uniref:Ion-translocating oxidoreductase complex subunit E n=1 Tax=Clostridium botulinum C/D str. DC5 TaxID=1443128 RepID=A0A0A0IDE1_CLOBO|nr:electron transport complex subunit E [Clostridium botulinum]KEI03181.1 electron transporter RsxE [Clostridium botulinum C/D str. BKT75002]KEI07556.1 electron transporter RsxE [Clostridium botulinum C/D str. BKT2873]KGM93768.1 electron transporter RsxE [Clostridium botulinum D str. CCUG 7971]KGM98538.1 electron transporter RsxE [Clostridium botulinum C/D str. DC5]KOC49746.1 electron transporter RsxE [Clostridium botulinum]